MYPNPTSGLFTITGLEANAEITIIDLKDQLVLHAVNKSNPTDDR